MKPHGRPQLFLQAFSQCPHQRQVPLPICRLIHIRVPANVLKMAAMSSKIANIPSNSRPMSMVAGA